MLDLDNVFPVSMHSNERWRPRSKRAGKPIVKNEQSDTEESKSLVGDTPVRQIHLAAIALAIAGLAGCSVNAVRATKAAPGVAAGSQAKCASLTGTQLGFGTVDKAEYVTEGEELLSLAKKAMLKLLVPNLPPIDIRAPRDFCRVTAELRPVAGSLVKVQVWLPDDWNGKMHAGGGGGFNGGLFSASFAMHGASTKGYASVVTDVGHDMSGSAEFAHNREQFIDYGYRGNHVTAVFTKDLIKSYYGKPATRAYFVGGSNGGREALMEARRFPEDYDGIVAGMPATSFTKLVGASFLWNHQAAQSAPKLGTKLPLVHTAVLKKCDALDGVTDQVLENPLLCKFDPAELQCNVGDAADCLNADEVAALRKIYGGPRLRDGTQVFPGQPVGGEGIPSNWDLWIVSDKSLQAGMGEEFLRWMVYDNPKWDKSQFDLDRDYPVAMERAAPILDSDDPDLSGFLGKGGKLIIHHGWADAAIPPGSTLNYHDALRAKVGAAADRQVRLFMVPGMLHGPGGGHAPTSYDMLAELDRWVEGGTAPDRVIASKHESNLPFALEGAGGKVVRTRPLCAWPKMARYNGSGSTDDAASFSCK